MRFLVFCFGVSFLATGSHPSHQERETPEEEWTVVSQIAESDENPVRVTLRDLWGRPDYYNERLVLVRGTLRVISSESKGETLELQEGQVAVPLLVKDGATDAVLPSFNGVFVEILGRFASMAPAGDRKEILNDIDSIFVGSLRRLDESSAEASTTEKEILAADADGSGKPPRIISSNPRPGERGVPLAGKIVLRFSEEMDEASFAGNVRLRYAGESESEDSFPNLQMSYNPDTASILIDPGQKLERRSEVHLFLQKGILSKEGVPMLHNLPSSRPKAGIRSRRSAPAAAGGEDVVVVLIFYTL